MADIAALGFDVDTTTLALATKQLNALGPAAQGAASAAATTTAALNTAGAAAQSAAAGLTTTGAAATAASGQINNIAPAANGAAAGLTRMQAAANANTKSLGAMKANTANIAAQFQDVGVTAAMGMAPLQIALQQGTQLAQVFAGMKPAEAVAALASGFGSLFSATSLLTLGFVGLTAVAIEYFMSLYNNGDQSAATLQKEAELIQKVAGQWGVALPALKAYADEQQRLVDQQSQLDALVAARGQSFAALSDGFDKAGFALLDMEGKLQNLGQDKSAFELQTQFDALREKVKDGTATQDDFNQMTAKAQQAFAAAGVNGNAFIDMLANLAGQASVAIKQMAGLNGEIDKIFGGNGSPNGRSIRGFTLGQGIGDPVLPGSAPSPDKAPNREDIGAAEDKLAARLARLNKPKGPDPEKQWQDILTGADNTIAKLEAQQAALGMTEQAATSLKYETELLNQANSKGLDLDQSDKDALHAKAEAMAELEINTKRVKDAMDFAKDVTKGFFSDFAQGIEDGKGFWKSFGDAALNALNKIVDKLLNEVIDALFQVSDAAGGGGGGILGGILGAIGLGGGSGGGGLADMFGLGFMSTLARGGVFDQGVQKFASGGVVDRPTAFGMSGGRTGLMGEAGPETIMPIKRMGNGDMGIAATLPNGGQAANNNQQQAVNINVNVTGANGDQHVIDLVNQGVSQGLEHFDQKVLPSRVNEIASDPRGR